MGAQHAPLVHQNVISVASRVRERQSLLREVGAGVSEGRKSQGTRTGDELKCLEWGK